MEMLHQEIEAMRKIIAEHDKNNRGKVIDMSRPVIVPYPKHIAFPKVVYMHDKCLPTRTEVKESMIQGGRPETVTLPPYFETRTVNSQDELEAAMADGWSVDPPTFQGDKKRGPGRPPKVV